MGQTTITVQDETLDRFKSRKETSAEVADVPEPSSDRFVTTLLNCWDNYEVDAAPDDDIELGEGYEEIAERIGEAVEFPTADVKEAMRDVLRDELPEGALR